MYYFLNWQFLGEVQRRLKSRDVITFTKKDVTVRFRYTHHPKNWDGSGGNYYSESQSLEMMVWWKGQDPRYTNWH
ncbi:hypothetical protein VB715_18640 [Crocosphaera sp. UHCC 0190]|uniref:hypothetical protein n=1 Tax=Crocosphaera sp. UHCC 0190 TaxID=3110246 RepID=UPI002B1EF341|nr:hypothetical protein [Crocosphaera sp. UHCC 0190]MEA5511794.1 hypothetical protein [Crocosphaera sp. UHCC 0190]